ncbi:MAG: TspO/MBR family protein [Xanthomonadales bacterium]|nr:TspO/MBR family protein [Xanthomonadales bacterium]
MAEYDAAPIVGKGKWFGLLAWLALCFAVSVVGAVASLEAPSFYAQLAQPGWAPPAWLFGPVWTVLFAMMAVAAWLVWQQGGFSRRRVALTLFLVQLAFNALWSWLFFAWQLGGLAFVDIVLLWLSIAATIAVFWRTSPVAGILLLPYLAWVSFAAALNLAIWRLNPGLL